MWWFLPKTFDPESPRSSMLAVLRFLEKPEEALSIRSAESLLAELVRE